MVMGYSMKHVEGVFPIRLDYFCFVCMTYAANLSQNAALKAFRQWRRKANQLIKARGMQGMDRSIWQFMAIPKETA